MSSPVSFQYKTANGKLAPQTVEPYLHKPSGRVFQRPTPVAPFVVSTSVSIEATCPDTCRFKNAGCYEQVGITGGRSRKRDAAARALGLTGLDVIKLEAELIRAAWPKGIPQDGARGGRDLRSHTAGDVSCEEGARILGVEAEGWLRRGGGTVWLYTARWPQIPREAWGPAIRVLASVQGSEEADEAAALGYTPAWAMERFESRRAYRARRSQAGLRIIPCPAETGNRNCAECRLCLRELPKGTAIGFEMHGKQAGKRARRLPVLGDRAEDDREQLVQLHTRAERELDRARARIPGVQAAIDEALAAMGGAA